MCLAKSKGDGGDAVVQIQQALNAKGANPRLAENGIFDNSTLAAVKSFQIQNNLGTDGIVGPATFQQLGILNV